MVAVQRSEVGPPAGTELPLLGLKFRTLSLPYIDPVNATEDRLHMGKRGLAIVFALILGLAGCSAQVPVMPDVVGKQLDVAKSDLKRANITGTVEVVGGGVFGVLDESNWTVCEQLPAAGSPATGEPRLTVKRACAGEPGKASQQPSTPPSTPAASPSATITGKVTDITVDKLVDKLNSDKMGGIKNGDLFRVTGELVRSKHWMTGASGDFSVLLKTKVGSDLIVFIDAEETLDWEDGMKVEMILEAVPVTIGDETTDGWMRARSARIVS